MRRFNISEHKHLVIIGGLVLGICGFLYIPQLFMKNDENKYTSALNKDIINNYEDYMDINGSLDFDEDGLCNKDEIAYGTNPYHPDSDNDGLSDFYEYSSGKKMTKYSNDLCNDMEKKLKSEKKTYENPFKSNDVILWAEDIKSRTYGTVILSQAQSNTAYVFDNFNGYAQFPNDKVPYDISTGIHRKLEYDKDTQLYKVKSGMKVVTYDKECKVLYKTSFFGKSSFMKDSLLSKAINFILPENGLITSVKLTTNDTNLDISNGTMLKTIPLPDKDYNYSNYSRFNYNNIKLSDLANVYNNINKGYSVGVSLIDDTGETLGIIYGYDGYGNLLVMDLGRKEKLGTIYISEHYTKLYTNKDVYEDYYWYSFKGLGYDSDKNARISFYASSVDTSK